mgnify:CR=1 FL=1
MESREQREAKFKRFKYDKLQARLTEVLNTIEAGKDVTDRIAETLMQRECWFYEGVSQEEEMTYTLDTVLTVLFNILNNYYSSDEYDHWSDDDITELECLYSEIRSFITETLKQYSRFPAM